MRALPALLAVLLLAGACRKHEAADHERYLEARRAYGAVFARTLDESCPEEPACAGIVAALSAIPADHPDAVEARKVLARIERARADRKGDEVPGFLREGEPALPGPDEVPAFLQERTGAAGPAPGREVGPGGNAADLGAGVAGPGTGPAGIASGTAIDRDGGPIGGGAADEPGVTIGEDAEGTTVLIVDGGDDPGEPEDERGDGPGDGDHAAGDDVGPEAADRATLGDDRGGGVRATAGDDGPEVGDRAVAGGAEPNDRAGAAKAPAAKPAPPADPCARYREGLAKRKDWLARTAAERNTLAHVADPEDHAAMLQLRKMSRCAAHPDDPDCSPPPIQAPIDALEVDPSDVSFEPGELTYDGQDPDDIGHDAVVRALENTLRKCEAGR